MATDEITVRVERAAKMLSVSVRTLRQWTRDGKVPCQDMGKIKLYSVETLKAWAGRKKERASHG